MHSSYGIGFDSLTESLLPDDRMGKNDIVFGANMNSSMHIDNKRKNI